MPWSLKDFRQISLDQSKSISQTIWFQNPFNCLLDHMSTSGNDGYSLPSCRRGKFCIRLKTLCKLQGRRVSFLKLQWSRQVKHFNGRFRSKIKIILQISKQLYLETCRTFLVGFMVKRANRRQIPKARDWCPFTRDTKQVTLRKDETVPQIWLT